MSRFALRRWTRGFSRSLTLTAQPAEASSPGSPRGVSNWLIALICALALIAGVSIASLAFERLPHLEDEVAYLFQARTLALGRLTVPTPQHADAFWLPFVLDYQGQRFGKYPPGWPAVLALGELVGAPWLVNPALAALALYLVYRLGRTLYDTRTGLLAAALGATSPLLYVLAGSYLSHLASLVLLLLFSLGFVRVARGPWLDKPGFSERPGLSGQTDRWIALGSGLALGLAFLTRSLTAVGYAAPFIMYSLFQVIRRRQRHWPNYLLIALSAGAVAALLPLYQWAVTGDPWLNPYVLWWPYDKIGFGPGVGWMPGGHSPYYAWINLKQDLGNTATDLLGWPGLSWLPVALALVLRQRNPHATRGATAAENGAEHPERRAAARSRRMRSDLSGMPHPSTAPGALPRLRSGCLRVFRAGWREWLLITPFVTLVIAYLFYWIGSPMRLWGPRYYFEGFGGLWILAAVGLWRLWDWLGRLQPVILSAAARRISLAGLTLLLVINLGINLPPRLAQAKGFYGVSQEQLRPIRAAGLQDALVFVTVERWLEYGALLAQMGPLLADDVLYPRSLGPEADAAVMRDYPQRTVYYLMNGVLKKVEK